MSNLSQFRQTMANHRKWRNRRDAVIVFVAYLLIGLVVQAVFEGRPDLTDWYVWVLIMAWPVVVVAKMIFWAMIAAVVFLLVGVLVARSR